jgi:hypothetical protein
MGFSTISTEFRLPGMACLRSGQSGNNPFVTVTTSHLVPDLQLTLLGYVDFGQFQDTQRAIHLLHGFGIPLGGNGLP